MCGGGWRGDYGAGIAGLFARAGCAARLVDVEVGLANDFEVEVLSGISENEQVILAPDSSLSVGQPVEALPSTDSH